MDRHGEEIVQFHPNEIKAISSQDKSFLRDKKEPFWSPISANT